MLDKSQKTCYIGGVKAPKYKIIGRKDKVSGQEQATNGSSCLNIKTDLLSPEKQLL